MILKCRELEEGMQDFLSFSQCAGKGQCRCICHMLDFLCLECKRMQLEAIEFLRTNPSPELVAKKKELVLELRRTLFQSPFLGWKKNRIAKKSSYQSIPIKKDPKKEPTPKKERERKKKRKKRTRTDRPKRTPDL